jgi:uracil-DNA glycosylase family 4
MNPHDLELAPRLRQILLHLTEDWLAAGVTHLPRRPTAQLDSPNTTAAAAQAGSRAASSVQPPVDRAAPATAPASPRPAEGAPASPPPSETASTTLARQPQPHAPRPERPASAAAGPLAAPLLPRTAAPSLLPEHAGDAPAVAPKTRAQRIAALETLAAEVRACTRCALLAAQRTQTVFGVGNPEARVVFFGEAPGADEDRQGEPFVGRAGQLLNKMLEACGFRREEVYIMNVLKCRPPGNRTPSADEVANCRSFFQRQLEILSPPYICCLGSVAAAALLGTAMPLGRLRGRFHTWRSSKVLCTYHPAYLLRNPEAKRDAWEDLKLLLRDMGLQPPQGKGRGTS